MKPAYALFFVALLFALPVIAQETVYDAQQPPALENNALTMDKLDGSKDGNDSSFNFDFTKKEEDVPAKDPMREAEPKPSTRGSNVPASEGPPITNPLFWKLPEDIQYEILEESERAYKECNSGLYFRTFIDCTCLALGVLDARIGDPETSMHQLIDQVERNCPNVPDMAGHAYKNCQVMVHGTRVERVDEFCTCYANIVAERHAELTARNLRAYHAYGRQALSICSKDQPL